LEMALGGNRFITLYFIAGVSGGLLSIFFAPNNPIIGASGAIYGVMLGFARFWPRERILLYFVIPLEIRWLIVGTTVWALYSGFTGGSGVANFAHLGGYVGAYIYLKIVESRAPSKQWEKKLAGPAPSTIPLGDWKQLDITKVHEANRDEVNRILDKINKSGIGSLTTQERTFLQHFVPTPAPTLPS
ncbi:MAG: rhomboid family intramembrane serine protease, partial [Gemmatimonadaceae bacterium]